MDNNRRKVLDFDSFVSQKNSITEGLGSAIKINTEKLSKWAQGLLTRIKDGLVKLIPSGDKKGTPVVGYFDPANGNLMDQVRRFYEGTKFSKLNPLKNYVGTANESEDLETEEEIILEDRVPLEYTEDDQSVRDVNAPELKEMIEKLWRSKQRGGRAKPIFIYGAPGIGKTQIVAQAAQDLNVPLITMDLQFMAPEDFLGIPSTVEIEPPEVIDGMLIKPGKGQTRSNPPSILPPDNGPDNKGGIIFMDEKNRANKMVLDATMNFVQSGRIGEYHLPDKWVLVAAGNRPKEATVTEFDFALADRYTIVNFVPLVKDWKEWAEEGDKVPQEVISFIERNEELFHYLDPEKGALKFPTPRSWTDAAGVLKDEIEETKGAKSWKDLPSEKIYHIFQDQIGPEAAGELKAYLEVILRVSEQDLENMVMNPKKATKIAKTGNFSSVIYGISQMAVKKAKELAPDGKPTTEMLANIMEYFNEYGNLEILAWIYKRLLEEFEYFQVDQETLDTRDEPDSMNKIKAAMMIQKGSKDKGILPSQNQGS